MSDSRVGIVSDSTAELIRLGETSTDRAASKASERRHTRDHRPDSTSRSPLSALNAGSRPGLSIGVGAGGANVRRSMEGSGRTMLGDASHSQGARSETRSGELINR